MCKKSNGCLQEFLDSLWYMIDSIQGKLSLESYLEILSQYTDSLIRSSEQEGLSYRDGVCHLCAAASRDSLVFTIELFFTDQVGQLVQKRAERALPNKKFTRESVRKAQAGPLQFHIDPPERG